MCAGGARARDVWCYSGSPAYTALSSV